MERKRVSVRNRVFVILPEPSQQTDGVSGPTAATEEGGLRKTLEEFVGRTTIPGLSQLSGPKGPFIKLCWVGLFFVGICMAIYQSRSLIDEYRRYAVLERSSREVQWRIPFPSATVCINQPVKWKNSTRQPAKKFVENVLKSIGEATDAEQKTLKSDYRFEEKLFYENLLTLDESEREKLGIPIKSFLISCTFGEIECQKGVLPFNNLYYGNCFTFNPGFDESKLLMASKAETLNIILRSDFEGVFPYMERDQGLTLLIHPPGSAPVLDDRRIYNLYPGRWLKLGVTMSEFNRLKAPYMSKCVDTKEKDFRSLYYKPERPYVYTAEACTDSCMQNLSVDLCDCVVPYLPVPKQFPVNVCPKEGTCDAMNENNADVLCGCRKSCKDRSYAIRVDVDDRWLTQGVWMASWEYSTCIFRSPSRPSWRTKRQTVRQDGGLLGQWVKDALTNDTRQSFNMSLVSGFELYVATTLFETIREEPKISWADFLGSIGGNLGLWVGISIISMVELLELMASLVVLAARNLTRIFRQLSS